jgi:uncharacterized protein (DUF1697 family)
MPRYVAFLRGVSPVNAKMADLKGNVVFTQTLTQELDLTLAIEAAMAQYLPRVFPVISGILLKINLAKTLPPVHGTL